MCFGLHASKRKRSSYEERRREGGREGRRAVFRSGGAHAGRGLTQAQPISCTLFCVALSHSHYQRTRPEDN